MKEALKKFDEGGEGSEIDLGEVYDHLAYAEYQVGLWGRRRKVVLSCAVAEWCTREMKGFVYQ